MKVTASRYGSRPASTLPPSSGGIGIMLNTASSTLRRVNCVRIAASGADTFAASSVCGEIGSTANRHPAVTAITRLLAGPAAATST